MSKPIAPPWSDASKNLVRTHLRHANRFSYSFFGTPASRILERSNVRCRVIQSHTGRFQPTMLDNVRPFLNLLNIDANLFSYFFTPNRRTSTALRLLASMKRRPTVHTICSTPKDHGNLRSLLFADRNVAVSDHTARLLHEAGAKGVRRIYPGIDPPVPDPLEVERLRTVLAAPQGRPCIVFSGDYEFSNAHPVILSALPVFFAACPDVLFVFACRPKTEAAAAVERDVRAAVSATPFASSIAFLRDVSSFPALLEVATVVIFPVTSLRNKMDIPLTLLEAMALGRPIVVSNLESLRELLPEPAGVLVPPGDADALGGAVARILKDDPERRAMGEAGRHLVRRQFSAGRMTTEYEDLYAELLS